MNVLLSFLLSISVTIGIGIILAGRIERKTRPSKLVENLRSEISGIIVELNATTDRNVQIIEDRIEQLKKTIESADRKIKLLHDEIAKAERGNQLYVRLRKDKPIVPPAAPNASASVPQEPTAVPPKDSPPAAKQDSLPQQGVQATPKNDLTPHQQMRARVWEMYAMGERIDRIAARVGRTEGEIELMVSLLRKDDT